MIHAVQGTAELVAAVLSSVEDLFAKVLGSHCFDSGIFFETGPAILCYCFTESLIYFNN